jgi:hypothetical protein
MPYVQWGEFCIILLSYTEVLVLGGYKRTWEREEFPSLTA